jgi:hypothetical protein
MQYFHSMITTRRMMTAAAFLAVLFLAGCNEHVVITRDPDIRIPKHATWAWRPAAGEPAPSREGRSVVSRDVIGRNRQTPPPSTAPRQPDPNDEVVRQRVRTAIEQTLMSKGFQQVSDPADAEFLVDYKFAIRHRNVTVPAVYPGAYPAMVCGPFGCWESYGWGPAAIGYEHIRFRAGTIVFDFIQQESRHLVYRAVGEKPVHRDTFSLTQGDINSLVHHLLKDLRHS